MPIVSVSWSRKVRWISLKRVERGQLDDRLDLALEEHRQHDDVQRRRLAQAGADPDVVAAARREHEDPLLLEGALADQALADAERVAQTFLRSR